MKHTLVWILVFVLAGLAETSVLAADKDPVAVAAITADRTNFVVVAVTFPNAWVVTGNNSSSVCVTSIPYLNSRVVQIGVEIANQEGIANTERFFKLGELAFVPSDGYCKLIGRKGDKMLFEYLTLEKKVGRAAPSGTRFFLTEPPEKSLASNYIPEINGDCKNRNSPVPQEGVSSSDQNN